MSEAVICDECGRILKSSDALHLFDKKADIHGWKLSYKKELKGRAK